MGHYLKGLEVFDLKYASSRKQPHSDHRDYSVYQREGIHKLEVED